MSPRDLLSSHGCGVSWFENTILDYKNSRRICHGPTSISRVHAAYGEHHGSWWRLGRTARNAPRSREGATPHCEALSHRQLPWWKHGVGRLGFQVQADHPVHELADIQAHVGVGADDRRGAGRPLGRKHQAQVGGTLRHTLPKLCR